MRISSEVTKGHLIVGGILILLSLICMIICTFNPLGILVFLIFFFGVWGGVETGRYLEYALTKNKD
jgi:hypothetical protein